jgi:hypothetical protein
MARMRRASTVVDDRDAGEATPDSWDGAVLGVGNVVAL